VLFIIIIIIIIIDCYLMVNEDEYIEQRKNETREHWIQRITFAAETNAAYSRFSADTHTHVTARRRAPQYLRSLSGGEGNKETKERKNETKNLAINLNVVHLAACTSDSQCLPFVTVISL